MPDLGKYAAEVGLAYGLTALLLAALIAYVWGRSVRTRRTLKAVEDRRERTRE